MHVAAKEGYLECVNLLKEAGADVTVLDEEDSMPLLLAVKGNCFMLDRRALTVIPTAPPASIGWPS